MYFHFCNVTLILCAQSETQFLVETCQSSYGSFVLLFRCLLRIRPGEVIPALPPKCSCSWNLIINPSALIICMFFLQLCLVIYLYVSGWGDIGKPLKQKTILQHFYLFINSYLSVFFRPTSLLLSATMFFFTFYLHSHFASYHIVICFLSTYSSKTFSITHRLTSYFSLFSISPNFSFIYSHLSIILLLTYLYSLT